MGRVTKEQYDRLAEERDRLQIELGTLATLNSNQRDTIIDYRDQVLELEAVVERQYNDLEALSEEIDEKIDALRRRAHFVDQTLIAIYRYYGEDPSVPRVLALGALVDVIPSENLAD